MSVPIRLVVGLGNPGPEYVDTRHNAGFWWIEELCRARGTLLRHESKFAGMAGRVAFGAHEVWLLEPQTFMNLSGRSVVSLARFYKILPPEILVVHDELDLPAGSAKLKFGGGHGGHNGLRDVHAHLTTGDYWRLRLGIGHPGDKSEVSNYVLKRPSADDRRALDDAIAKSVALVPDLVAGRFEAAMLKLHTKPSAAPAGESK